MTKKTRSPAKQPSSPNPRPKQRNRQTSVDRFFALKPNIRAKIDEAMSSNTVDSPYASDNDSNNPNDVLRDDDEDEVPTDHSSRSEPSESEYNSATDTAPVGNKSRSKTTMDPNETSKSPSTPTSNPKVINRAGPNSRNLSDTEDTPMDSPDSKPRAKATPGPSLDGSNASEADLSLQDTSRRLFDNRKHPPSTKTTAKEIIPPVLDDLLYKARQYDATLIEATSITTSMTTQLDPMETDQDKQAEMPGPRAQLGPRRGLPAGGRGRGGGLPLRLPTQAHLGPIRQMAPISTQPLSTGTQSQAQIDNDSPMPDAQAMQDQGPDFSFMRPVYVNATPSTPGRKIFLVHLAR
jgi:hypothetical protein